MKLRFRQSTTDPTGQVGPDELWLVAAAEVDRQRRDLAKLALERGPEGFCQGAGPIRQMILKADPTFDDLLAAELLGRLIEGQEVPAGAGAFAQYAQLAREGLGLGEMPAERSIEGIFLAIVNSAGPDLSDPAAAERFCGEWARMARRVLDAAEQSLDPFTTTLFDDAEFARQRAYLARDREVYRQDVTRGERWIVSVPDAPPDASGLLLRKPKSLLFKHWARGDEAAPTKDGYLLLAVRWAEGNWVFSTDPVHRLSLKPLWEILHAAEMKTNPQAAQDELWFDGAPFAHTLIAAPRKGSRLGGEKIVQIVKKWSAARVFEPATRSSGPMVTRRRALAAAGVAGLLGFGWWAKDRFPHTERGAEPILEIAPSERPLLAGPRDGKDYALLIATERYEHWSNLSNPIFDATHLAELLETVYGFQTTQIQNPTTNEFLTAIGDLNQRPFGPRDQQLVYVAGHGDFHRDTKEGFVVLRNSLARGNDPTRESFVAHSRLRDKIEKIRCDHILVVLDVCFGGTFDFATALGDTSPARSRGHTYQEVPKREFIRRKMARPCRRWLTSGAQELVPDGRKGEHSPFAERVFVALESGRDTGVVTLGEIIKNVDTIETEPRNGDLAGHEGGDFLFIRKDDVLPRPRR